jgi:hypothetical protein
LFSDGVSNEIRANNVANVQARGVLSFNVPSLISVFASAPYLHSGAAATLDDVLRNVTHRTAGRADHADFLTIPLIRRFLVQFLKSIDRDTPPFTSPVPPWMSAGHSRGPGDRGAPLDADAPRLPVELGFTQRSRA